MPSYCAIISSPIIPPPNHILSTDRKKSYLRSSSVVYCTVDTRMDQPCTMYLGRWGCPDAGRQDRRIGGSVLGIRRPPDPAADARTTPGTPVVVGPAARQRPAGVTCRSSSPEGWVWPCAPEAGSYWSLDHTERRDGREQDALENTHTVAFILGMLTLGESNSTQKKLSMHLNQTS